jgi:alkylation response protein AidB-like acyl-CoA dehydrogenase
MTNPASMDDAAIEALLEGKLDELLDGEDFADPKAFWGKQFDLGLSRLYFAEGHGGLKLDPSWQQLVDDRLKAAGAPSNRLINGIGLGFAAPTIEAWGTEEQKRRYLRPMFTTDEIWCQLFSEPGAGSDLAGLATRAVKDGDEWIVNGQKVWTSLAHKSDQAMLVARTDPNAPKHKGLSYFVVDIHAPGVDVRPLRQMTGEAEFNEVYLTDVRLPDSSRIGELGTGWKVSMTTLANERQTWVNPDVPRGAGFIGAAVQTWRDQGHTDPARRNDLLKLWVKAEVYRLNSMRAAQAITADGPGPEGSIGKVVSAELNKEISSFAMNLLGGQGLTYSGYDVEGVKASRHSDGPFSLVDVQRSFLRARANSIEAGSTEINKNILAERILGLPGDIKIDRNTPWNELKRN